MIPFVDLKNELADVKGVSERNIGNMLTFYKEYPDFLISPLSVAKSKTAIGQLPVAQLGNAEIQQYLITNIGWVQNITLIQKVKDLPTRYWYMQQSINNGWTRDTLVEMINSNLHKRQGVLVNNFDKTLPSLESELAKQLFKDPYIFDFMTLSAPFTEREIELELVKNVEKFLVELGAGFAFVGRQYKIEISEREFYLDLLFYHLKMRNFIVIELKKGEFIPEYAGKMNFYCSAVDDLLKKRYRPTNYRVNFVPGERLNICRIQFARYPQTHWYF